MKKNIVRYKYFLTDILFHINGHVKFTAVKSGEMNRYMKFSASA
jgi:hypothetical protein